MMVGDDMWYDVCNRGTTLQDVVGAPVARLGGS